MVTGRQPGKRRAVIIGGSMSGLFTAAFLRQIGWQVICLEGFDVHFDQADQRIAKFGPFPVVSIDHHSDGGNIPTVRSHNVDRKHQEIVAHAGFGGSLTGRVADGFTVACVAFVHDGNGLDLDASVFWQS